MALGIVVRSSLGYPFHVKTVIRLSRALGRKVTDRKIDAVFRSNDTRRYHGPCGELHGKGIVCERLYDGQKKAKTRERHDLINVRIRARRCQGTHIHTARKDFDRENSLC